MEFEVKLKDLRMYDKGDELDKITDLIDLDKDGLISIESSV